MYTKGNGKTTKETAEEYNNGKMDPFTKAIGRIMLHLATVGLYTQMAMSILDNG